MTGPDDTRLLTLFVEDGNQQAFAELVRRHGPMVLATIRRSISNRDDADEAFQATFFALAKSANSLRNAAALAGWLHRTAYCCAVEVQRANARRAKRQSRLHNLAETMKAAEYDDPSRTMARRETEAILDEELTKLPAKYQNAMVLCDLQGWTQRHAAEHLRISAGALNLRLDKGRKLLRDRLVRRGVTLTLAGITELLRSENQAVGAIAESTAASVSAKAALFAAGKSAEEIGVSMSIVQSANKVLLAMSQTKIIAISVAAVAIVMLIAPLAALTTPNLSTDFAAAAASEILFDDFTSPNPTDRDRQPVRWLADAGSISIIGDRLLVSGNDWLARAWPADIVPDDVSVRTSVKSTPGAVPFVQVRFTPGGGRTGYSAYLREDGTAAIGFTGTTASEIASANTNLNPSEEEVFIQLDAIGDELSLYVWRPNEKFPSAPTVSVIDGAIPGPGQLRLGVYPLSDSTENAYSASFDFIRVATSPLHLPEPSAAAMSTLGSICVFVWSYRSRYRRRFSARI